MTLSFPHCGIAATTVTIVDGSGTVLSAGRAYRAAPGVWLPGCAAVRAGRQSVLQVEFDDGSSIALGGEGSSVVVDVPAAQGASMTQVLVSGWAKLTVSERTRTAQRHVTMPMFEVQLIRGSAVMHADDRTNELFVESGSAIVRSRPASRDDHVTVAAGHTLSRVAGASGHRMGNRPTKSFLEAMPRAFRDTLPLLRKSFLERKAELVLAPGDAPQDKLLVAALLELRDCQTDAAVRRAQQVLLRMGMAVGPADGILGPRTVGALREFQSQHSLRPSGELDDETLRAMDRVDQRSAGR